MLIEAEKSKRDSMKLFYVWSILFFFHISFLAASELPRFRIIMVGDTDTGKSSLLARFTDHEFVHTTSTIGVDFRRVPYPYDKPKYAFHIWDTAGQERFRAIAESYFRGAQGVVLVFDLSDRDGLQKIERNWHDLLERVSSKNLPAILVGNKSDLQRRVTDEEAKAVAAKLRLDYFETSAKIGDGVDELFHNLFVKVIDAERDRQTKESASIDLGKKEGPKKKSWCFF